MPSNKKIMTLILLVAPLSQVFAGGVAECNVSEVIALATKNEPLKDYPELPDERIVLEAKSELSQLQIESKNNEPSGAKQSVSAKDIVMDGLHYRVLIYPISKLAFVQASGGLNDATFWYAPVQLQGNSYIGCPVSELHKLIYDSKHEEHEPNKSLKDAP